MSEMMDGGRAMTEVSDRAIREATERLRPGASVRDRAREYGVPKSTVHDFFGGRESLGQTLWRALYRAHPELRWLLEEYQRRAALGGDSGDGLGANETPDPVATSPPGPRS